MNSISSEIISNLMVIPINKVEKYKQIYTNHTINIQKYFPKIVDIYKNQKIPLKIHQTHNSTEMDIFMYNSCIINKNSNPEYEYFFYDENDRILFIKNNYPEHYISAYNNIIPGAYKADLFRYLLLYKYGGVYIDCKSSLMVPLRDFINPDKEFIIFRDRNQEESPGCLQNGFFASVPNHPLLKLVIDMCIFNITNKLYNYNSLDITGPLTLGRAFFKLINKDLSEVEIGEYEYNIDIHGSFIMIFVNTDIFETFVNKNDVPILKRIYSTYYKNKNSNYYGNLWNERKVYKND
jgi:mannosyltransferase OCH1-like enzyme